MFDLAILAHLFLGFMMFITKQRSSQTQGQQRTQWFIKEPLLNFLRIWIYPPPCLFHPFGRGYIPTLWIVVGSYPETNRGHHFTMDGDFRSDSILGAFQNAGYLRLAMHRVKMQHLVIISFSWMEFLVCCKKKQMHVIVTRCGAGRSVLTWLQGVCIRPFFKQREQCSSIGLQKNIYRKRQPHVWGYKPGFLWIETAIQSIVAPAQDGCFQVKNTQVLDGGSRDAWSSYRIGKKRPELWPVESGLLILLYYGVQLPCICTYMHVSIYIYIYIIIHTSTHI